MWNWGGRPKRDIPQVNYAESSSDKELPFKSPTRPFHTREGSPAELFVPPLSDNVDEVLEEVSEKLVT